jgi:peptidoglycan hydrolase CwlO-like protein
VQETVGTLRDNLSAGLAIYHSIDQLPFVSLPAPSQEQVDKIQSSVGDIQSAVDSLQSDITSFRSGVSGKINKVQPCADLLTSRLGQSRDNPARQVL